MRLRNHVVTPIASRRDSLYPLYKVRLTYCQLAVVTTPNREESFARMRHPATSDTATTSCDDAPTTPWSYLLNEDTAHNYAHWASTSATHVASTLAGTKQPFTGVSPESLGATLAEVDLAQPLHDTAAALAELDSVYLNDAVYFHHPR